MPKLSQIATTSTLPSATDTLVGVHSSNTDTQYSISQVRSSTGGSYPFGGRLTLATNAPLMSSNVSSGTIYYTPYVSNVVTMWDSISYNAYSFSETSVVLDATNAPADTVIDLFIFNNGGVPTLGYNANWSSNTARTQELERSSPGGFLVNSATISLRTNSSTTFSLSEGQASYVGSAYLVTAANCNVAFATLAAGGGGDPPTNGLWNMYNRVMGGFINQDNTASWTYTSTTWRLANNAGSNVFYFITGILGMSLDCSYSSKIIQTSASLNGSIGVLEGGLGTPPVISTTDTAGATQVTLVANLKKILNQGFHQVLPVESGNTGVSFTGSTGGQSPGLQVFMEY